MLVEMMSDCSDLLGETTKKSLRALSLFLVLGLSLACRGAESRPVPMQLVAFSSAAGGMAWSLRVAPDGAARLALGAHREDNTWEEIETLPYVETSYFRVPGERIEELRHALERENFFALAAEQGHPVFDTSRRCLRVTTGDRSHMVTLRYMDPSLESPEKVLEQARAVRVFSIVREWIPDERATDLAKYDAKVLRAAATLTKS